jgi:hypothetical protein
LATLGCAFSLGGSARFGLALADEVVRSGFCLRVEGRECAAPIESGSRVRLRDLPRDADGRRVIYFFSATRIEHARFLVHSMARGPRGATEAPTVRVRGAPGLPKPLLESVGSFGLDGRPDVMNFIAAIADDASVFRAFTSRHASSYGPLAAKVLDPEGKDLPGGILHEIEIVP